MTKQKSTKKTLLTSMLSLILCIALLIGTTFAWFTDNVTSANNKIVAGNLDVQLLMNTGDGYKDISESASPIFGAGSVAQNNNAETLWEPGKTQIAYLAIKNNGNLALKYTVALDVENVSKDLYEVMEYAITPDTQYDTKPAWAGGNAVVVGKQAVSGTVSLGVGATHYFALSIHMQETAGNEYMNGEVNFDLTVLATQDTVEADSFDNQYDDIALISNADALVDAIAAGKNVMLTNDVALDVNGKAMTVAANAEVLIDLNGNDIIGTTTASDASQVLFEVKGELTVVGDGTIALYDKSGAAFNQGYENAAIYVDGGVANLNEGMIVCASTGEAMAYAADAVGGNSVINVNGATLYSSYIGVRSFPTASGKTNTINYNSGVVYGGKNGYDIWTQEGNGTSIVNIADGIGYTREDQWGGMYYVDDDVAYVGTATALKTALTNDGEVVLVADIIGVDANTAITVATGKDVTLDLNGHKITAAADKSGNQDLFLVKGNMTVKNGSLELTAKNNQGWSAMAAIFDVTAGGVLNLEDVNATVGGTDMNFVVHMNNWGTATLNADNCVFDATYCGVRVFNSGPDMNNVKIENSKLTGKTRALWVQCYTSEDMGGKVHSGSASAYDKAVVDARLNFDIYGNNNTFTITDTTAKAPIRYGDNGAIVFYDAAGNIVP